MASPVVVNETHTRVGLHLLHFCQEHLRDTPVTIDFLDDGRVLEWEATTDGAVTTERDDT